MKTPTTFVLALSVVSMMGAGLYAQTRVVANIPFDFTVQTATMPAGEYELSQLTSSRDVIQIRNLETRASALVLAPDSLSTHEGKGAGPGKVIFNRYGDRYFFSEIWTPNGPRGRAIPSKLEQEVKANGTEKQMAAVTVAPAEAQ